MRRAYLVMNFFADEDEHFILIVSKIALDTLDPDVMIGDDDGVYAGFDGCICNVGVRAGAVGIGGVHMEVDGVFVHDVFQRY